MFSRTAAHDPECTSVCIPMLDRAVMGGRDVANAETQAAGEALFYVKTTQMSLRLSRLTLGRKLRFRSPPSSLRLSPWPIAVSRLWKSSL